MRITEDYSENKTDVIEVKSAKYIGDFAIRIEFNDGTDKLVDFKPFLERSSHPSIRKYLEVAKFEKFDIIDGNLNWNDYDLIFPVYDLYQGKI
ncbi:MAG: DUF2442 domain-containing protein [Bacteroidia bacterium]